MTPILFEKTETEFLSNGVGSLSDCISCTVTERRNGEYELNMEYPVDGIHATFIATDMIIGATPAQGKDLQPFRIYCIEENIKGIMTVYAEHISYQLSFIPVEPFSASDCASALAGLKMHASEDCPFTFWTDKTTAGNFSIQKPAAIRKILGGMSGSILDIFGTGEYEFDKWAVKFHLHRGSNNGVFFRYGKNIIDIEQEESIANTFTGVAPYWTGYDDNLQEFTITLPEKVLHSEAAANFPFHRTVPLDLSSSYSNQPTEAQLRNAALAYMENNNIGVPKVSITLDVAALWQSTEYEEIKCLEEVNLCDTVTVVFPKLGIDVEAKVTGLVWNVLKERYDSISIGDSRTDLAGTITNLSGSTQEAIKDQANMLEAEIGVFKELTAEHISAVEADIDSIRTTDLVAVNADITNLNTDTARIKSLLSGNAGVGDLLTITLNSQNASIDTAMLRNLIAQNVTVGDLLAGEINTDKFTVTSADGRLTIQGGTLQIQDEEQNVRVQLGEDALGNYTFAILGSTGQGVLFDETGIKPGGIPSGIIIDDMIAYPSGSSGGINAAKLDVTSLYELLNDDGSGSSINASRIYFNEEGQSLSQIYSQLANSLDVVEGNQTAVVQQAEAAQAASQTAVENSQRALEALSGITTLDALGAQLTNDAHVVHTNFDGSGGDFTYAKTTITAYLGEMDITDSVFIEATPSQGVTGTWNPGTRTYQVTDLTTLNGYVDFEVSYGRDLAYFLTPDSNRLEFPNGDILKIKTNAVHLHKRFSISKSPDGRAGSSYNLLADTDMIRLTKQGTLSPSSVTFSSLYSDGVSVVSYMGIYGIETSTDGVTFTEVYKSAAVEISKRFVPTSDVKSIRCTLYDAAGQLLDVHSVIILMDAQELMADVGAAQEAIQTVSSRMTTIETGMSGLQVDIADVTTELHGVSDKVILYQVTESETATTRTFTANVYKNGKIVTEDYPASWFKWYKKIGDGSGEIYIGTGRSVTINKSSMPKGGSVIGEFVTFREAVFITPDDHGIVFPDGNRLSLWIDDYGQFEEAST